MERRKRFKIAAYLVLLAVAVFLLIWWMLYNRALSRDYVRLTQIKLIQSEMTDYFYRFNTYEIPSCPAQSLVNYCLGSGDRTVDFNNIIDPKNSGDFQYIIVEMSPDNFLVTFSFEQGVGGLPAGNYVLTKEGIGQ